jgi:hypothetical protein
MKLLNWTALAIGLIDPQASQCAQKQLATSPPREERLQVDSLHQSWLSGLRSPTQVVVRDSAQWPSWWSRIDSNYVTPNPPLPAVDFSSYMLVVIGTGNHSVSGFLVRIDSAVVHDSLLTVYWADVGPGPGCPAGTGPSRPVAVVRLPLRAEPVRFEARVLRTRCG